jgi:hypothetical protein
MTDILKTMLAELDEATGLLRPHFPHDDEQQLRERARIWTQRKYETGMWPAAEIAERAAAEAMVTEASAEAA